LSSKDRDERVLRSSRPAARGAKSESVREGSGWGLRREAAAAGAAVVAAFAFALAAAAAAAAAAALSLDCLLVVTLQLASGAVDTGVSPRDETALPKGEERAPRTQVGVELALALAVSPPPPMLPLPPFSLPLGVTLGGASCRILSCAGYCCSCCFCF